MTNNTIKNNNVIISTESACELPQDIIEKYDIRIITVPYYLDGEEKTFSNMTMNELYQHMTNGQRLSTSQINEFEYMNHFENLLKENKQIVHIGFSSGLSGMFNSAMLSLEKIDKHDRENIFIIDTKAGSLALGILVEIACQMAQDGASANEIVTMIEEMKNHVSAIITANELKYLRLSGRISKISAYLGSLLSIKPIFKVSHKDGKFEAVSKVLSRKKSLVELLNYFKNNYDNYGDSTIYISHANCFEDAQFLQNGIVSLLPDITVRILEFGAIIGGHSGPGTIAIFFTSK